MVGRKRESDVARMERSRQRGADKLKARRKPGARVRNRRAEYGAQYDEHGKPIAQWCYLCNAAHGYHRDTGGNGA